MCAVPPLAGQASIGRFFMIFGCGDVHTAKTSIPVGFIRLDLKFATVGVHLNCTHCSGTSSGGRLLTGFDGAIHCLVLPRLGSLARSQDLFQCVRVRDSQQGKLVCQIAVIKRLDEMVHMLPSDL
ncbi:hypothetical protein PF003_g24460 [Phytophthora fragariae]|nr:hypothetical protein PF003_g24460 [Phytophthora fragariae]